MVWKVKQRVVLLAVLLAICAAYANSFENSFHFDDFHTVTDNPAIRNLHNIPRFFVDATTFSVLPANQSYRPVVSTMLALDYALSNVGGHGYVPFWFHLGTFLSFLALVTVLYLFYFLLLEKTRPAPANVWLALFGAAWFGLHPAMAETVNYVIQRGDLYCTLGSVAALLVYARYPSLRRMGLYLLPLAFALLSKPPAAVFPLLLAGYVFFFEAKARRVRAAVLAALPSLVLTALLMALESAMTPRTFTPSILSASAYRLAQPYVWLRYCSALLLPVHLNVDSDLGPFSMFNLQAALGLVFVAALLAALWLSARRQLLYPIAFGLYWFVLTELPTSLYPLSEVENDHRMFFSFPGLILAVVWSVVLLLERVQAAFVRPDGKARRHFHTALLVVAVLVLAAYAHGVVLRNRVWHDEESLWLDDVQKSPHNGRGLMIYGLTQMSKGKYPAALTYFDRALLYDPKLCHARNQSRRCERGDGRRGRPGARRGGRTALSARHCAHTQRRPGACLLCTVAHGARQGGRGRIPAADGDHAQSGTCAAARPADRSVPTLRRCGRCASCGLVGASRRARRCAGSAGAGASGSVRPYCARSCCSRAPV